MRSLRGPSANSASNPDPAVEARYGDQSWAETTIGFLRVNRDRPPDVDEEPEGLYPGRPDDEGRVG